MKAIVAIALRLPDGRLVMQRRDEKAPTSPNKLGFFGGSIEHGEDALMAATRELKEETSLDVDIPFSLIASVSIPSPTNSLVSTPVYLFQVPILHGDFEVYEGLGSETYTVDQLLRRTDLAFTTPYLLEYLKRM